jgi:hypothetical protein
MLAELSARLHAQLREIEALTAERLAALAHLAQRAAAPDETATWPTCPKPRAVIASLACSPKRSHA